MKHLFTCQGLHSWSRTQTSGLAVLGKQIIFAGSVSQDVSDSKWIFIYCKMKKWIFKSVKKSVNDPYEE